MCPESLVLSAPTPHRLEAGAGPRGAVLGRPGPPGGWQPGPACASGPAGLGEQGGLVEGVEAARGMRAKSGSGCRNPHSHPACPASLLLEPALSAKSSELIPMGAPTCSQGPGPGAPHRPASLWLPSAHAPCGLPWPLPSHRAHSAPGSAPAASTPPAGAGVAVGMRAGPRAPPPPTQRSPGEGRQSITVPSAQAKPGEHWGPEVLPPGRAHTPCTSRSCSRAAATVTLGAGVPVRPAAPPCHPARLE